MKIDTARCCFDTQLPCFSRNLATTLDSKNVHRIPYRVLAYNSSTSHQKSVVASFMMKKNRMMWRADSMPVSVDDFSSVQSDHYSDDDDEIASVDSPEKLLSQPLSNDELKSLLADSERQKLTRKLSEANQQNRFLKRQLHIKEDALVNFKSELAVMELQVQALVSLAEEIAKLGIPGGSRKINGKFIQSHLLSRLEAVNEKLKEQIKDVGAAQSKEVSLFWCGMAESVQVMGSFDGWSQGEHLSPEYTGSFTKFSTTLMLRPGRYEIKFLIDGEWQLSPEFPTVGEGLTENNLLIVE
ncbi:hypothetical protein ACOSP7_026297 [Xanthoceras sorbifolium]|uniref:AMP-activated protein kinase glycogen-binding domain-containing protein n=1 Tax=Xanthoceras sorbifolium TaxID=99658 RepID=A0ABQ8HEJ0_9ROSI|nr:hypothetical protein JRO89_XS11G0020500 [Xanthoceras sorbifolium]